MLAFVQITLLSWALLAKRTDAHGYMKSPAARNSAWRLGFDTPANYDDNELFCGGRETMHLRNGGRCGVCGDDWRLPQPRPHERGGQFGKGLITANYTEGQIMPITIHLAANHMGWYEFRLCNNNNPKATDSQRCLDKQLLQMADGSGTRYQLNGNFKGSHTVHVKLPAHLSCSHCVLQWTWVAGNTWGICPNGKGTMGCGPQETFVNCADISILPKYQKDFGYSTYRSNKPTGSSGYRPMKTTGFGYGPNFHTSSSGYFPKTTTGSSYRPKLPIVSSGYLPKTAIRSSYRSSLFTGSAGYLPKSTTSSSYLPKLITRSSSYLPNMTTSSSYHPKGPITSSSFLSKNPTNYSRHRSTNLPGSFSYLPKKPTRFSGHQPINPTGSSSYSSKNPTRFSNHHSTSPTGPLSYFPKNPTNYSGHRSRNPTHSFRYLSKNSNRFSNYQSMNPTSSLNYPLKNPNSFSHHRLRNPASSYSYLPKNPTYSQFPSSSRQWGYYG